MLISLLIAAACVGLGSLHAWLSRLQSPVPGLAVPVAWLTGVVLLLCNGYIGSPIRLLMIVVVTGALVQMYSRGRSRAAERIKTPTGARLG